MIKLHILLPSLSQITLSTENKNAAGSTESLFSDMKSLDSLYDIDKHLRYKNCYSFFYISEQFYKVKYDNEFHVLLFSLL